MKRFNFNFKSWFKFKLNKRGVILLIVALLSLSMVTTIIVIGSIKSKKNAVQQTIVSSDEITPEPIQDPENIESDSGSSGDSSPSSSPAGEKENVFIYPKEDLRPIAVIIDNEGGKVLPQGGIGQAQIVYEVITEYGITRYIALFWDNLPDLIGPVRSLRHYFLDYLMEYNPILTHVGWSDYAYWDLQKFEIDNIDGVMKESGGVFWDLTREKDNYHDTYTSPERLSKYIADNEYSLLNDISLPIEYHTHDKDPESTQTAKDIFIKYNTNSNCGYYYDSTEKNYKRTRQGQFQTDRNTKETIRVKNIVIQYVKNESIVGDTCGRQELYTTGSGKGYFITNGLAQEITWEKSSRTSHTEYRDAKGDKIKLNPGQTWIQIVPPEATVNIK